MGDFQQINEVRNYIGAIKEHYVGVLLVAAVPAVAVWAVSKLRPYATRGNQAAALLVAILNDLIAWITHQRYALISNSFLLGVIFAAFLAYSDVDRQLKNPITITFEWANERPFLEPDTSGRLWIRAKANNNSPNDVVCRVFLNDLEKIEQTKPLWPRGDSLELLWSGNEYDSASYAERTVPAALGKIFNLAYIAKNANELSIQPPQFSNQVSEKLPSGTYSFTIQASHSTCRSDPIEILVKYDGQQNVSFVRGPTSGH
jgi:hypothetical protein